MTKPTPTVLFGKQYHWREIDGVLHLEHCLRDTDLKSRCIGCGAAVTA